MNPLRTTLLAASQSLWLREKAMNLPFVRRAVSRFLPGEELDDALSAARALRDRGLTAVLTRLGENVSDPAEAEATTRHYLEVLRRVGEEGLDAEISVKLTQLGLDLGAEQAHANLARIVAAAAAERNRVWIDMEDSRYTDATLDMFRRLRGERDNTGVCVQSYLRRTPTDLDRLIGLGASVRLVKGAYMEPAVVAFPRKHDVDESYFALASRLLSEDSRRAGVWAAFGTHDRRLIRRIAAHAASGGVPRDGFEFELLYGIQTSEQLRLASEGYRVRVLISYGDSWFPWYMRRLAERPANLLFVVRNLFRM
jgi:proline dehydrogenase